MRLAERMDHIGTETAFEAAARARALAATGRDIIHLHLGEPDFDTPPNIVEAAARALRDGQTHYAPPPGVPAFREAIAADFSRRRGVEVTPDRVVVTPGAKPVMAYLMMALVGPGDEVIVPDPGFPIYDSMARFMGATPVPIPLRPERDFRLDLDELRSLITPRTRLLVFNSPQNPTGAVMTRADIEGIAAVAMAHDLVVLADEIYSRILYEGEHVSILTVEGMEERTVVLDGLSKTYAMTGWRLGWGILPKPLVPVFERLLINTVSCTATYAQVAGAEALNGPQDAVDAHGPRVPRPPRTHRRRAQRPARRHRAHAGRGVLRVPRRERHGHGRPRLRRPHAQRGRGQPAGGHGVRETGDGQPARLVRQLARQPARRAHPHGRPPGRRVVRRGLSVPCGPLGLGQRVGASSSRAARMTWATAAGSSESVSTLMCASAW